MQFQKLMITGPAGFIASNLADYCIENELAKNYILLDAGKTGSNFAWIRHYSERDNVQVLKYDLAKEPTYFQLIMNNHTDIDGILHLASESHVDRSIADGMPFILSNVVGTGRLFEFAREYLKQLKIFLMFSTDEVMGQRTAEEGKFKPLDRKMVRNVYCVHPDSIVYTVDGYKQICEIEEGEEILSSKDGKNVYRKVLNVWRKQTEENFLKINHKHGSVITSKDHRFFIINPNRNKKGQVDHRQDFKSLPIQEIRAEDLKSGMWLILNRVIRQDHLLCSNSELLKARFLGFYVGNGNKTILKDGSHRYINVCSGREHIVNYYKNLVKNCFGNDVKPFKHKTKECWYLRFGNIDLWNELNVFGLNSREKNANNIIHGSDEYIAEFLAGLFDADGSFYGHVISFSSFSETLRNQVKFLLRRLGIISTHDEKYKRIIISDCKSREIFSDKIKQIKHDIPMEVSRQKNMECEDYIYTPFKSSELFLNNVSEMIDLEIEETEKYYCDDILVHNSATKSAQEELTYAYSITHKVPTVITRCTNVYGPRQYPEKFLPVILTKLMNEEKIPVYGEGLQEREWVFVEDVVKAVIGVLKHSLDKGIQSDRVHENIFHIGGETTYANIDFMKMVIDLYCDLHEQPKPTDYEKYFKFVEDRKGHDFRYDLDCSSTHDIGLKPTTSLESGLRKTIQWYLDFYAENPHGWDK
jgi:dTDP-D-glucose 4,6-dehydratase